MIEPEDVAGLVQSAAAQTGAVVGVDPVEFASVVDKVLSPLYDDITKAYECAAFDAVPSEYTLSDNLGLR